MRIHRCISIFSELDQTRKSGYTVHSPWRKCSTISKGKNIPVNFLYRDSDQTFLTVWQKSYWSFCCKMANDMDEESEHLDIRLRQDEELDFFTELALHETERWIQVSVMKHTHHTYTCMTTNLSLYLDWWMLFIFTFFVFMSSSAWELYNIIALYNFIYDKGMFIWT